MLFILSTSSGPRHAATITHMRVLNKICRRQTYTNKDHSVQCHTLTRPG